MKLDYVLDKYNNNELDTFSASELKEAYDILCKDGSHPEVLAVVAKAVSENKDLKNKESEISAEQFKKNSIELNKYSEQAELDEESKKAISNLVVEDANGKPVDVSQEIIEAAKINVVTNLIDKSDTLNQDIYNTKLQAEISNIMLSIMGTKTGLSHNMDNVNDANQMKQDISNIYNGQKVKVSQNSFMGAISAHLSNANKKIKSIEEKVSDSSFLSGLKNRIKKVDESLTSKFGEKYTKIRGYAQRLAEQGTLVEVAAGFASGMFGPAGLVAYSGFIAYRRVKPLVKQYKETKKAGQVKGFGEFVKTHKKDCIRAGLYIAAGVAGIAGGGAMLVDYSGIENLEQVARNARLMFTGAATVAPQAIDVAADVAQGRSVKQSGKKLLGVAAGFAAGVVASHFLSDVMAGENANTGNGNSSETPVTPTQANGEYNTFPWLPEEKDSIIVPYAPDAEINGEGTPIVEVETETPVYVGEREQALYERNMKLVPDSATMKALVEGGYVELPKGMTSEMAVNLARVEYLYYGNDTGLKALLDCDSVTVDTKEYFKGLTEKFVIQAGDERGYVGFPTDPNYQADPTIHTRIETVDCQGVVIDKDKVVTTPPTSTPTPTPTETPEVNEVEQDTTRVQPIDGTPAPKLEVKTPEVPKDISVEEKTVVANNNLGKAHYDNPEELNKAIQKTGVTLNQGEVVEQTENKVGTHHQNTANAMNNLNLAEVTTNENGQLLGADGKPLDIKKGVTLTPAQIQQMLNGGNTQ